VSFTVSEATCTRAIWALAFLFLTTAAAGAASWQCEFSTTQYCSVNRCERMVPSVYVTLDPVAGTYSRCDRNRCDHFTARASDSGRHVDIQIPSVGAIAKMTRDGSALTEIVTAGNDVYLSFGACRPL
jgi:hypothetical protein